MGLTDKIHNKFSSHKDSHDADKTSNKSSSTDAASVINKNDSAQSGFSNNRAALYGDELDLKAGRSLGHENLITSKNDANTAHSGDMNYSSGKDTYGNPATSASHTNDAYTTNKAVTGEHSSTARGTDIPGTSFAPGFHSHSTGAVSGNHSSTARGTDLPGNSFNSNNHAHKSAYGTSHSALLSGTTPRSKDLGEFTTGDQSLDEKIGHLDPKGQTKAKEAFEKGYKEALKSHGN